MKTASILIGILAGVLIGFAMIFLIELAGSHDREVKALAIATMLVAIGAVASTVSVSCGIAHDIKKTTPEERAKQVAALESKIAELKK